jgi:hypothetical protein
VLQHEFQLFRNCHHILCCEKYVQADLERRMSPFLSRYNGCRYFMYPGSPQNPPTLVSMTTIKVSAKKRNRFGEGRSASSVCGRGTSCGQGRSTGRGESRHTTCGQVPGTIVSTGVAAELLP